MPNRNNGQVLAEYAIVLSLVAAVLVGMQVYMQRGLQGRYKDATDKVVRNILEARESLPEDIRAELPILPLIFQYEPYYQESELQTTMGSRVFSSYRAESDLEQGIISRKTIGTSQDPDTVSTTGTRTEHPFSR